MRRTFLSLTALPQWPGAKIAKLSTRRGRARSGRGGRDFLTIAIGTASAQAILLLSSPLLTRLYTPIDFGLFSIISAAIAIMGPAATLRIELAIPLPEKESDAHALIVLAAAGCIASSTVLAAAVFVFGSHIAGTFAEPGLENLLWAVPAGSAAAGILFTINQMAIRQQRFRDIALRNLVQAVATTSSQVGLGLARMAAGGLVFGITFGYLAGAVSLTRGARLCDKEAKRGHRLVALKAAARRYRAFPLLMGPASLLNALGAHLPLILIGYWYAADIAGWLGLTQRVLSAPVTLMATAASQVYLSRIARLRREQPHDVRQLFIRLTKYLVAAGLALAGILVIAAPDLFSIVFGADWATSGEYARLLAPAVAAQLVAVPLSQTLIAFEAQRRQLLWDAGRIGALIAAFVVIAALDAPAATAILTVSVVQTVAYSTSWLLSYKVSRAASKPGLRT